jgi:asparagine synthase (glutamine-hydrolysing)
LEKRGISFDTTSDTEVVLRLYISYGTAFLSMLNGIYAFAIYDEAKDTLYLVRDHFGIKPLYFTQVQDTLFFASRMDTLFTDEILQPKINDQGLNEIFTLGPSKTSGCGVFQGVQEVKPGEVITISRELFHRELYYKIVSREHTDSYGETLEKTRYLVESSIKQQMLSDVPVATFLSGGIDSSIVSSVCGEAYRQQGKTLDTYSFDYKDNSLYFHANSFQPAQDRPFVDIMVNAIQSNHTYLECDYEELADLLYDSVDSRCLPTMADVDSSLLYFCGQVAKRHKVVLTGECADEIFGGYPWFYRSDLLSSRYFPWINHFSFRTGLLKPEVVEALHMEDYLKNAYYNSISEINILPWENETETRRRRIAYLNIRWFMQTLLDRMDRTSMHSGLEARVPFADHRIVDYVFNVPWEYKYRENQEKHLLRHACKGLVPDEILFRKKSPYPKTYHPGYEKILANRLQLILFDRNAPLNRYVDKDQVLRFLSAPKDYGKPWFGQLMAGPQMIAYLIQVNYWLKKYRL